MAPDLEQPVLISILATGLATAFLHAAIPTHWLPFVLVGRAQGWSLARTLGAVLAAGLAHIATTAVAGALLVAAGLALNQWLSGVLPWISAGLLFAFGLFYLARAAVRRPVLAGGPPLDAPEPVVSHLAALLGLMVMMAASPGEVLLPVYLTSAGEGATVFLALTLIFALGTVAGMALFTTLARAGASLLKLERWARYEGAILGAGLILLGLLMALHRH